MPKNLTGAVEAVFVFGRLQPLHPGFDHVDGGISVDGGRARDPAEEPRPQFGHLLVLVPAAVNVLQGEEDPETDRLIRSLLDDGRAHPLVTAGQSLVFDDGPHAVEESLRD